MQQKQHTPKPVSPGDRVLLKHAKLNWRKKQRAEDKQFKAKHYKMDTVLTYR